MKILVLQLARLGDILLTSPAISALKRSYPNSEIHYLSREKFSAAAECLPYIDKHYFLPTTEILEPLIAANEKIHENINQSVVKLDLFLNELLAEKYDWIINFTFSPLSSYLVHYLSKEETKITGYTRHSDGYFSIADEVSSYFYAQVGIKKANRIHLADIFAAQVGLELSAEDWFTNVQPDIGHLNLPEKYLVVHVGASEEHKSLPGFKWARILKYFGDREQQYEVVLIGASSESAIANEVQSTVKNLKVTNLVGATTIPEIFTVIKNSSLVIGCDSAPMHIASLTQTPCLNLSVMTVNFWETGPRAMDSFIYLKEEVESIESEVVAEYLSKILNRQSVHGLIRVLPSIPSYDLQTESTFSWELIQAIYFGEKFPILHDLSQYNGILKLYEINQVIIENLMMASKFKDNTLGKILSRGDEIMSTLAKLEPQLQVLVNWIETEKLRVGPISKEIIISEYLRIHNNLSKVLRLYLLEEDITKKVV